MLIALYSNGRRAGKDTVADFIEDWIDENGGIITCERTSFARAMKIYMGKMLLGLDAPEEMLIDKVDLIKLHGSVGWSTGLESAGTLSGRDFIINLSEAAKTLFGEDFWIDRILPLEYWRPKVGVTVVTDMRFPQEFARVVDLNGIMVKIEREGATGGRSENLLDDYRYDYLITNNGSKDELRDQVAGVMEQIMIETLTGRV